MSAIGNNNNYGSQRKYTCKCKWQPYSLRFIIIITVIIMTIEILGTFCK